MEVFNVPRFYLMNQAPLALAATGRITGLSFVSGHGVTEMVPIFEGYGLKHAIFSCQINGAKLTEYLQRLLCDIDLRLFGKSEWLVANKIKESRCFIQNSNLTNIERQHDSPYTLPDGREIFLGDISYRTPELMFNPSLNGVDDEGIIDACLKSINGGSNKGYIHNVGNIWTNGIDIEIRQGLLENIVLSGGNTLLHGFKARVFEEITQKFKHKVRVSQSDRGSALIGGKIYGSLSSFKKQWITREDYEEYGSSVIHRKCFQ